MGKAKSKFTELDKYIFECLNENMKETGYDYTYSWWLRLKTGIPTPSINYRLNKFVSIGLLKKETTKSYTKYIKIK